MDQNCYHLIDTNHCSNINRTFDHRPPMPPPNPQTEAYYGSLESYRPFVDTNQTSNAVPGTCQGLYHPDGPLDIGPAYSIGTFLTEVKTKSNISLSVSFVYNDESANKTVDIEVGKLYAFTYLENTEVKRCCGKVVDLWKVYEDNKYLFYKIKIDCSVDYSNQVVVIKNDQIRGIVKYTPYCLEDTTILNSVHKYGTTVGTITNAIVTNATVDANGNIIDGDIVAGVVDGHTLDGIAKGQNSAYHEIMVTNGDTLNGSIEGGKVITATCRSGDIDGSVEEGTNITVKATVKGTLTNVVVADSTIRGGKTTKGTFLDPELEESVVYNAQITGSDLITTGGITSGNITTGGTTTGGTANGGTATGMIDGKAYTIEGGNTVPKDASHQLITSGGVVVGGTIIGGVESGNVIIGAVIKGGVVTQGTTVNGKTTGGTIVPSAINPIPITKVIHNNPDQASLGPDRQSSGTVNWPTSDNLIVFNHMDTGQTTTNVGTAKIEGVDSI